jgi:vacuolar-type H+-ATPase subunit F/Vma7
MIPLVVGTREDVAGFALAGIEGMVCETSGELEELMARKGPETLLILSGELAPLDLRSPLVILAARP